MNHHHPVSLRSFGAVVFVFFFAILLASCSKQNTANNVPVVPNPDPGNTPINSPIPKSAGTFIVPAGNPMNDPKTPARIELGRHLFFDRALSVDGSTSCGSCHNPGSGFADPRGMATSFGFGGRQGTRNAPALANVAYNIHYTWDGKFNTLEDHALAPIFNNIEMANNFSATGADPITSGYYHSDPGANDTLFLFGRIDGRQARTQQADPNSSKVDIAGKTYYTLMMDAWGTSTYSLDLIQKSIACFERTFISTQSTFDRFNNGDPTAYKYNPEALHGFQLFTDVQRTNCVGCHSGYNFSDQQFHNNGLAVVPTVNGRIDSGRVGISKDMNDAFKFRTPSLRNVALSAPYMHDGRKKTLDEVMAFYKNGGDKNVSNKDPMLRPSLNLNDQDISDIIEFLKTLTDPKFTMNTAFLSPWSN
jgi:cytochrome c peroxidase